MLKRDKHLGEVLPEKTKFRYKKAPNLRRKLVKNVVDPPTIHEFSFL